MDDINSLVTDLKNSKTQLDPSDHLIIDWGISQLDKLLPYCSITIDQFTDQAYPESPSLSQIYKTIKTYPTPEQQINIHETCFYYLLFLCETAHPSWVKDSLETAVYVFITHFYTYLSYVYPENKLNDLYTKHLKFLIKDISDAALPIFHEIARLLKEYL